MVDKTCITQLFKHQKQALYFLLERERELACVPPKKSSQQIDDEKEKEGESISTAESMCLRRKTRRGQYVNLITGEAWNPEDGLNHDGKKRQRGPHLARGGILADDMGLGKTIEAICLVISKEKPIEVDGVEIVEIVDLTADDDVVLKEEMGDDDVVEIKKEASGSQVYPKSVEEPAPMMNPFKPNTSKKHIELPAGRKMTSSKATLIVCPLSTISNWEDQIAQHVIRGSIKVYVFHGPHRRSDVGFLSQFDVILTTYNVLSLEYTREIKGIKQRLESSKSTGHQSVLHRVKWKRVILDEAHVIKDANTGQARSACALDTNLRWCLSGTVYEC